MKRGNNPAIALGLLCSMVVLPAAANAQQGGPAAQPVADPNAKSAADRNQINDIIVTAQRRNERAQDVPIAINAFSAATLARSGVTTTSDLGFVTPGFTPRTTPGGFAPSIRGIGSTEGTVNAENAVPIYVDGVYYASMAGSILTLNDIERVEVLKGPQGTLFGRNAAGGLVNITTRRPSQIAEQDYSLSYANYDTVSVKAYMTEGLAKNLAVDVSGAYEHQARGWGINTVTGRPVDRGSDLALRSKLLFTPSAATTITLEGDYSRRTYDTQSNLRVQSFGPNWFNISQNVTPISLSTYGGGSLTIEHGLGFARLLSISAYHQGVQNFTIDSDGTPAPVAKAVAFGVDRNFTQEVQFQSLPSSKLRWIAGAFYMYRRAGYTPLTVSSPFLFAPFTALNDYALQRTNSYSGFAQVTYPILPQTNITLGVRYTSDNVSLYAPRYFTLPSGVNKTTSIGRASRTFNRFTYRASIDHHLTSKALLYVSFNTGFKGGVYNLGAPGGVTFFANPQTVTAYEAGVKTDWLDGKLRLNLSAFHYDEKNVQVIFITTGIQEYVNAGSAKISGIDFEGTLSPTPSLQIQTGASYLPQARYGTFGPCPNPGGVADPRLVNCNGQRVLQAPKLTLTASATYRAELGANGAIDFTIAAQHSSAFPWDAFYRYYNGAVPSPKAVDATQQAYDLVNATVTWHDRANRYSVSGWGKNLTNKQYSIFAQGVSANNDLTKNPAYQSIPGAPRTYGVTLAGKF